MMHGGKIFEFFFFRILDIILMQRMDFLYWEKSTQFQRGTDNLSAKKIKRDRRFKCKRGSSTILHLSLEMQQ